MNGTEEVKLNTKHQWKPKQEYSLDGEDHGTLIHKGTKELSLSTLKAIWSIIKKIIMKSDVNLELWGRD